MHTGFSLLLALLLGLLFELVLVEVYDLNILLFSHFFY